MGTALAVDHSLQVFSAEHFATPVHGWTCSAAPLHDPVSGKLLGVLDLSGPLQTAHPHSLALVTAAARMVEAVLLRGAGERVEILARQALAAMVDGDTLRTMLAAARRLFKATPINTVALRRRLADEAVQRKSYPI